MTSFRSVTLATLVAALTFQPALARQAMAQSTAVQTAPAGQAAPVYEPQIGQQGKDVVWVPTPQALVDRMLDMGGVTAADYVIDLGSGDGRTVITAAKRGARAHGIEYNPDMVELAKRNAATEGVTARATFEKADIFESDFSKASVITLFLLSTLNLKLRPILLDMKPGTRVLSNTFNMDDWESDDRIDAGSNCTSYCRAYLWVIPAKVGGTWQVDGGTLQLTQTFQMIEGMLTRNGQQERAHGRLRGNEINFSVGNQRFVGKVDGNRITGAIEGGAAFNATRTATQ